MPSEIRERLERVRGVALDVDGVLADGGIVLDVTGQEIKRFDVKDGLGIRLLLEAGIRVAVISGRRTRAVSARCRELGIPVVIQGSRDKARDLDRFVEANGLDLDAVAAMGDDLPDLPMLTRAGLAVCPGDAHPEVAARCHLVCGATGGHGAVRELAEVVLKAQDRWWRLVDRWHGGVV